MRKKAIQQGRSERSGGIVLSPYGEPLNDARTPLADFFRILLGKARGRLTANSAARLPDAPAFISLAGMIG